jgi:hypothetical protein
MQPLQLRRSIAVLAGLGAVATACTSILGQFTQGSGATDASTEASRPDAAPADGGTIDATDGGVAEAEPVDAPPGDAGADVGTDGSTEGGVVEPFTCTTWKWAQPLVLESLEGATDRKFGSSITAFPTKANMLRIVVAKNSQALFSAYTVDVTTEGVTQLDQPGAANDTVVGIWRERGAGANVTAVVDKLTVPMLSPTYSVHLLQDTMPSTGPVPAGFNVYEPTPVQTVTSMTVAPISPTNAFEVVAYSAGTTYTLGVGDVTSANDPPLATVATALTAAPFNGPHLYQVANGDIYIYNENDPSTPGFTSWAVPPTGDVDGSVPPLLVESGKLSGVIDVAPNTSQPSADVLTYEIIKNGNLTETYNLRLGVVPNSDLGSWSATSLPLVGNDAGTYQHVQNAPIFSGNQVFWGDDILMMGQGYCITQPDGGCMTTPGMNALWLNATSGERAQEIGSNRLLTATTENFFDTFTVPQQIGATSASWYVVWGEHLQDEAGTYDVLYMNVLQCQ